MRTSTKNTKKWCRNEAKIHEKSASELNKKRCLKTELKKTRKSQKMTPKWLKKMCGFWGKCLLGRLWWSKPFLWWKSWPPALPKCAQERKMSQNSRKINQTWAKNGSKKSPEWENLQKSTLFGAKRRRWAPKVDPFRRQARRTVRSAYNIEIIMAILGPTIASYFLKTGLISWYDFSASPGTNKIPISLY